MKADDAETTPTPADAYAMGDRHIADLAPMNRIADAIRGEEADAAARRLLEARRQGPCVAQAIIGSRRPTRQ